MVLQRFEAARIVRRSTGSVLTRVEVRGRRLSFAYPSFVHTVLVDMRARLRTSERPDRIFEAVLDTAKQAGLVGRRRVLDSTSLYDAVATMDTVTLIRSAIRGLLAACDGCSRRGCVVCSRAMTITRALGSRSVITRTARRGRADRRAREGRPCAAWALDGSEFSDGVKQAGRCSRRSSAKTLTRGTMACSGSPDAWRRTGSSRPSIRTLGTVTRPAPAV